MGTCLAYGQTGAGKTFTMTGLNKLLATDLPFSTRQVKMGYFELFGDDVFDLLNDRNPVAIRSTGEFTFVSGLKQIAVSCPQSFLDCFQRGSQMRRTRATLKNETSSRTHSVCSISFADDGGSNGLIIGPQTLLIVDLAGSERNSDQADHDKVRIKETQLTNASLMTLKECIRNRYLFSQSKKHIHIPFRSSKLTLLLKESLDPTSSLKSALVMVKCS